MHKAIICSTGTSAAKLLKKNPKLLAQWIGEQTSIETAASIISESFIKFSFEVEGNLKDNLSAEIHSLVRIGIDSQDRIILLASSTDDGYACALAVEKYLKKYWPGIAVETEQIKGLQVNDAKTFRTIGVVEFVKHILRTIDKYGKENVILNPTGGFKALVPYTVLIGMLKSVTCRYIFEQSTSLLELPPLPVEFSQIHFDSYQELFDGIEENSDITKAEWDAKVPYHERNFMEGLFEFDGESVTLSAIGHMFVDEIRKPTAYIPYLSQKAIDDCFNNLRYLENCDPFRYIRRVSASTDTLQTGKHISVEENLFWLKPGQHTTDRYLVSLEGKKLLVWRAIREDQEGKNYCNTVVVKPSKERSKYAPFLRMEFVE